MSLRATVSSTVLAIGGPDAGHAGPHVDVVRRRAGRPQPLHQGPDVVAAGVSTAPSEQACTASGGSDTSTGPIRQSMSKV